MTDQEATPSEAGEIDRWLSAVRRVTGNEPLPHVHEISSDHPLFKSMMRQLRFEQGIRSTVRSRERMAKKRARDSSDGAAL